MKSIFEELTSYRVKVERDGKEIVNVPGIMALPGALLAPKMSILGTVAASLLGCNIHLENEDGKSVDIGREIRKATDTVVDTAKGTAKSIKEEIDKVWDAMSADDPEECPVGEENREDPEDGSPEEPNREAPADGPSGEENREEPEDEAGADIAEQILDELEKHKTDEIPTIHVENPDKAE